MDCPGAESLVCELDEEYAREALPEIEEAFQKQLVDEALITLEEIRARFAEPGGVKRSDAADRFVRIVDTVEECRGWRWYPPPQEPTDFSPWGRDQDLAADMDREDDDIDLPIDEESNSWPTTISQRGAARRPERTLSVRQRQEIQEVLRPGGRAGLA